MQTQEQFVYCVSVCHCVHYPNICGFFVSLYTHCINQYVLFYTFVEMPVVSIGRYQLPVTSTLPVPSGISSEEDEQELLPCKIQGTVKCLFRKYWRISQVRSSSSLYHSKENMGATRA